MQELPAVLSGGLNGPAPNVNKDSLIACVRCRPTRTSQIILKQAMYASSRST